jgi:hypothetical protein
MNFKKLITTFILVSSALMTIGIARAQQITNYDFTATLSTGAVVTGDLTLNPAGNFTLSEYPYSNVTPFLLSNFKVDGVSATTTTLYFSGAPVPDVYAYGTAGLPLTPVTNLALIYSTGANQFARVLASQSGVRGLQNSGAGYFSTYTSQADAYTNTNPGISNGSLSNVVFTAHPSGGGAPEIDGSLAPKIGFLLGCLFLMFGKRPKKSYA